MNPDNSETAEVLKKLMVACLAGLEADYVTRANLTIDAGVRRCCRKKIKSSTSRSPFKKLMPSRHRRSDLLPS
jgi:hypothetical protein